MSYAVDPLYLSMKEGSVNGIAWRVEEGRRGKTEYGGSQIQALVVDFLHETIKTVPDEELTSNFS